MLEIKENLEGKSLLLAVSGGLDSVCLLHFFSTHFKDFKLKKIAVVHVDHALRGKDSKEDATFVEALCEKINVPFYFKSLEGCLSHEKNVEAQGRLLRYEFFKKIKTEKKFDYLLTAHHGDDQAETVFMRMTRGTSILGLKAIRKFREDGIYRPFLEIQRKKLEDYAKENQLLWREDSTNKCFDFRRNEIRLRTLPILKQENSEIVQRLLNISNFANKALDRILETAESLFSKAVVSPENWTFPKEFSPYKKVLCLNWEVLNSVIDSFGKAEIFRLWLSHYDFTIPLQKDGSVFFPKLPTRTKLHGLLIEKSGNFLWFFKTDSFSPLENLYLYTASENPEIIWRFRQDGDFYTPNNLLGKRRKWVRLLQEKQIPQAVRNYLPLLAKGSKILRMATPADFAKKITDI